MKTKLGRKRGISTVLTTIIILVASVVLGSGVVLYGTSLFQGGTQQEAISVQGVKVWVDPTDSNGLAWGAAGVRNSGDKIVSVDKIQIRGTDIPFAQWYVDNNQTRVSVATFQTNYIHSGSYTGIGGKMADSGTAPSGCTAGTTVLIIDQDGSGSGESLCMTQASGPTSLNPGDRLIVYFQLTNGTLSSIDSGASTSVNIFAGKTGAPQSITVANP